MVEPEVAFLEFDGLCDLAEEFVCYLVGRVLDRCREELKVLERDTAQAREVVSRRSRASPTPRRSRSCNGEGNPIQWGDDFGGDEETLLASAVRPAGDGHALPGGDQGVLHAARPGEPGRRARPRHARARGLRRDHRRQPAHPRPRPAAARASSEHNLPVEAFQWYLDVRKYGTFPHSGFGMGIERFVAWMCGLPHLRETIPYPRMLYKIYP